MVVGAFGDVNEALEKVLKRVAKAAAAMDNFYDYANEVVQMQLPEYFYTMSILYRTSDTVGCRCIWRGK